MAPEDGGSKLHRNVGSLSAGLLSDLSYTVTAYFVN